MPTVEEIAEISPICSIIVANAIGIIATIELIIKEELLQSTPPNTVPFQWRGKPIQEASTKFCKDAEEKSNRFSFPASAIYSAPFTSIFSPHTKAKIAAMIQEPRTPRRIGMIFAIPLPQMLKITTIAKAIKATNQFCWQLFTALPAKPRPIAIIIGPVTTGGKNRITFFTPTSLINAAKTRYTRPAQATPKHA